MAGRYKPYPEYKDSGVEWLGVVPSHWALCPSKRFIMSSAGGTAIKGACADEQGEGLFPAFSASGQDVWLPEYKYELSGLVLSAVGARCGKTFKADGKWGVVANTHCLIPTPRANRDFLWYLTNIENWWEIGGSAQPFVLVSPTLDKPWVFPSIAEQSKIANFLDHETAKIDTLIEKQQQLIQLLKEKRQAVISHAVTKGLNHNVKMRNSGVELLGEVPEGWSIWKLKHACSEIFLGLTSKVDYVESGGVPLVRALNISGGVLNLDGAREISLEQHKQLTKYRRAKINDVLLSKSGTIGTAAIVDVDAEFSIYESIFALRPKGYLLEPEYLLSFIQSSVARAQYERDSVGMGVSHLNMPDIQEVRIPLPPRIEQRQILLIIRKKQVKFDLLIRKAEISVSFMQERRTALISAAVTGKIDLRDWVALPASPTHKEVAA